MELILWRHAEAEKSDNPLADAKRRLSSRGLKQAQAMAAWLKTRLPMKTRILVGPSLRACETADCLQLPYTVDRNIGVGADSADLLAAAGWPDGREPVLLVCHQPALGRIISLFVGGTEAELPIKKCGVFWFSTREREHRMQVVLRAALYPDLV